MTDTKRRGTVELCCKYEGMKQDYGRDCTHSELARVWGIGKMSISRWYNGLSGIPEARLVWILRRYKSYEGFTDEFIESLLADYPVAKLKELLYE